MPTLYSGLGTEALVDEVFFVMREKLNAAIAAQAALYQQQDQSRATRLGATYEPVVLESIDAGNFHVGDIPSFVQDDDREEHYPMCVVMPGNTVPDGEDGQLDQLDVFQNQVAIHVFARAMTTDDAGFQLVYRRSMRMAEAVHKIMKTDPAIRRLVAGLSGPTLVTRSEPWISPRGDGHGDDWCWRAVMTQYQVKNYSETPMEV